MNTPTPAETRESCRRLLDPPKLRPVCHYCRARAAEPGQVAAYSAGWDTRPGPAGVAWWRCPACRAEDGAEAALSIPVRAEPGLWEPHDVAVPLLWDAFANLFVIGCLAGPVVLVGLAFCAWVWRWTR